MRNKEEILQLKNNLDIKINKIITLDKKKNNKSHKSKIIFSILLFSMIYVLMVFILLYLLYKKFFKNQISINDNNSLFISEPSDDYNKISFNNISNTKEELLNITLPKETYTKKFNNSFNTYLTQEMVDKFNNFTNACIKGILIDNKRYPLLKNPKISVIVPLYNGGKYLYYSLRSIQNQKMKDIEIILVDDLSTDNTLKILDKYMKEDERIRLIKNIDNRMILYSKSMAALNSRGKYIIQLDQDDIFIRDDVFDILYYEAKKDNLDLVHIRDICKKDFVFNNLTKVNYLNRHYIFPKKTHYKTQPELKDKMFIEGNNYLLWGLLIKADIYKKAVYHMWPIIINYKITFHEDYMISYMIVILSQKYKYLNNFALIHLFHSKATSKYFFRDKKFHLGVLFFANCLYDYYIEKYPQDIRIMIHYIRYFKAIFNIGKNTFSKLYNFLMKKVVNNEYLLPHHIEYLKTRLKIDDEEFKILNTYEYLNNKDIYENIYNFQMSNINIKKEIKKVDLKPKISIIIICSESTYLEKTINSIQNQNSNYFEIIIIYDNEEQTDYNLILNYIKKYPYIKLINNIYNKGYVYSISTGVLLSKGEYILILELSNTIAKENTLNELYDFTLNNKLDILEFNLLINIHENITNNSLSLYKCQHFQSEINLTKIKFNENYIGIDQNKELLTNKLIKANLFKNIVNKYKFNLIKRKLYNYYDNIFFFALNNTNNVFKHINIFGVIRNIHDINSLKINKILNDKNQKIKDSIFYINFLFENSKNTLEEKEFVIKEYFSIMNLIYNKFTKITKESFNLYKKFVNCIYISKKNKNKLKFYYNTLIN